jgi:hypothetical protein
MVVWLTVYVASGNDMALFDRAGTGEGVFGVGGYTARRHRLVSNLSGGRSDSLKYRNTYLIWR